VLVLWSPDNRVMPPALGHQLARLIPQARYAEIPGAYVLSMLDQPEAVTREMGQFLTSALAGPSGTATCGAQVAAGHREPFGGIEPDSSLRYARPEGWPGPGAPA
jgi:hypothetical protein